MQGGCRASGGNWALELTYPLSDPLTISELSRSYWKHEPPRPPAPFSGGHTHARTDTDARHHRSISMFPDQCGLSRCLLKGRCPGKRCPLCPGFEGEGTPRAPVSLLPRSPACSIVKSIFFFSSNPFLNRVLELSPGPLCRIGANSLTAGWPEPTCPLCHVPCAGQGWRRPRDARLHLCTWWPRPHSACLQVLHVQTLPTGGPCL